MSQLSHFPARLLTFLDDRMNPIVVKELRQAVQSRFITGTLNIFLLINLLVIGGYLINANAVGSNLNAGRDVFISIHGILFFTALQFVPLYTAVRLATERSETNVDLLFISSIPPAKIVWGKLLAGMIIAGLIYSACLPFLTLTFLLRGIDLPSIAAVLMLDLLLITAGLAGAIFCGCIPVTIAIKGLLTLMTAGGLMVLWGIGMSASYGMIRRGIGSSLGTINFWTGTAMPIVTFVFIVVAMASVLATAMITPPSANRALPVRICMTVLWLVTGLTFVATGLAASAGAGDALEAWALTVTFALCLATLAAVSERDTLDFRIRRTIPQSRWKRALILPFYSGSVSGLLWVFIIVALTVAIGLALNNTMTRLWPSSFNDGRFLIFATLFTYTLAYALTAMAVRYWLLRRWIKPVATATIALVLIAVGVLGPVLIAFLLFGREWDSVGTARLMLGNPLAGVIEGRPELKAMERLTFSGIWALIAFLLCLPTLLTQLRNFRPPDAEEYRSVPVDHHSSDTAPRAASIPAEVTSSSNNTPAQS